MRAFNSTIKIKEKICIICGKPCIWFSKKRCQQCTKLESFRKREEKDAEIELGDLIKDADFVTSRYIRLKYSDERGIIKCYTCNKEMDYYDAQCGHFISRQNMFLRFDLRNLRPQCNTCNCYKHGRMAIFRKNLNREQSGLADILMEESNLVHHISREEIRGIIADYTTKIKLLLK